MSLSRDIPFNKYSQNPLIKLCGEILKVSSEMIFRGPMVNNYQGPYLSQFLYLSLKSGFRTESQKYCTVLEGSDFLTTPKDLIANQNGTFGTSEPLRQIQPRYLLTGRDLADYVHQTTTYEILNTTSRILEQIGVPWNYNRAKKPIF